MSAIAMVAAFSISGCGGSSKPPAVAVTASVTTVDGTDTVKLTATVTNDKSTGGTADGVSWSVSGGGTLSDTTTSSATYTAPAATSAAQTVTVTAASVADTTQTGSVTLTIPAKPAITAPSSTQLTGAVGAAYSLQLAGTGGIAPYTWTLTGGTLPTGWTLTTAGLLSGPAPVAGQAGAYDLTFTSTDTGTPTALTATLQLTVTIDPAPAITFTGVMPATVTYNATYSGSAAATGGAGALTYSLASGSGPLPAGLSLSAGTGAIGGTATATGAYPFIILAVDGYGDSATQAYTITVNAAAPTLSFAAIPSHTYGDAAFTASASSASSGTVTYSVTSGPATINSSTGAVTITGAGTVVLGASQAATANYTAATATITFTVNKAAATVVVTPYTVTYDGNAHTATATATGVGGATLNASDVTLTGTTHTNAGTYATDAWSFTDASGNYSDASGTVDDKINQAAATIVVTPYIVTYDAAAHTATATATGLGGANLIADLTLTGTTHTNAGSYASDAWSFTDPNGNYANASGTVSDSIAKAAATVNVTGYTVTYDGTAHTAAAAATGVGGASLSASDFTLTGTTHTNAGSYASDAWSFADINYVSQNGMVSDTINLAAATVNVTGYTVTYNGNAHTATATATGVGGISLPAGDFTLTGTTHTNAGTYTVDAWSFADQNYVSQSGTVSDTINLATPTLAFAAIPTKTYGNAAFPASASSASTGPVTYSLTSGPATIDSSSGAVTITGAGTVVLGASQAATANYNAPTPATITFTVNQAAATIVVTPYTATYDGNAHTATATATGVGGAALSASDVTLTGTTHTNAGSYAGDAWSFTDASGNYLNASGTVTDKINQAAATIAVTPYSVTYDATAHTATATATGVGGVTLPAADVTLTGTTHTNAGTYATDAWSFADASGNYANASGTVSDTIAKATATVNVTGYTVTYDATAHTAAATATGVGSVSLPATDFTLTGTAHTNVGTYANDAWSFADANYISANGTVSDSISPATATVNVAGYTVTYNGSPHTATATATGVGGVSLPGSDLTLTGTSHTNAGTYASDAWSFADLNYVSQSGTVSDTINAATATINVTPYTVTYNGNAHTATATATGAGGANLIADLTLTGTTHTNAGTYAGDPWSFTDPNGNYQSANGTVTDTINQASAAIVVTPYTVTYNGNAHTATATATGAGGANLPGTDFTLTGTTHTNAGTYAGDPWSFSDASGNYANASGTITDTINPANPGLSFTPIGTKVNGNPLAGDGPFTVSASSASAGAITYSVTSGPATISGSTVTPTGSGTVNLHAIQAANGNYAAATANTSFQVNPTLTVTTTTLPSGTVGTFYSQQLQANGGNGTYSWTTDTAGTNNLAAVNLGLSSTGLVSGTPTNSGGPESFTVTLSDGNGHSATATLSVTVTAITITTTSLPIAYTNASYSQQLSSTGGTGGNTWTVSGTNNLSNYNLTLSASGLLSGPIPANASTGVGIVTFTAKVTDSSSDSATKPLTITVFSPLTLPTAGALHAAITGQDYGANNVSINASGGSGSYSFSVNGTSIPTSNSHTTIASADSLTGWNSGNSSLWLGGTPPDSGTITLSVTVTDTGVTPNQSYGPVAYTIVAAPQQPLALPDPSTNPLPTPVNINQGYNAGLNATGGANGVSYSFSVKIGSSTTTVPTDNSIVSLTGSNGLTAQNSGGNSLLIGGTPTVAGSITLQVTVNDSASDPSATQSYTINIINPLAGYNVSGTVNYTGSKTGWIYLELQGGNCGNCSGPGTAISAKGAFTIKGVQSGNYTLQAYMDPLGYGAPNASDPSSNLFSSVNVNVNSAPVTGVSVTLGDPSAITLNSAPSVSVAGAFATGAFVQLSNLPTNNNGVEMATSYTVRYSTSSTFSTGTGILSGSQSFPATGGNNAPYIVSGLTNGKTYYFEVEAVAGSSNSGWSSATSGVAIVATPATGNNAVSGQVTFPTPTGGIKGPLYVGFYDQNTGNVYATVIANPVSPQSYSLNVPTGSNYFLFGIVDQNNNGVLNSPGEISNTNQQSNASVAISGTTTNENFTLPTTGSAPTNSVARITTQHNQQINSNGTNDNYNIDIRVDGLYKLPASVEVTSKPAAQTVVVPSDWATGAFNGNTDEFDFQPNLNGGTPQVNDAYNLLVTYTDGTSETLTVTIGAVLNALATLNTPAALATGVSPTPNFSWSDPANPSSYTYQFQLQDTNYNNIWQIPGNNSKSNGFSDSITAITWDVDPTGGGNLPSQSPLNSLSTYQWSIQATDANGNSATEQVEFETGESSLTLPDNSNPGSALVNSPYSQSLNASGGSGSGYVFTVNSSAGTTNAGVTTWTLTDGLTASSTVGNSQLTVSGTPTSAPATVTLAVSVVDSQSHSAGPVTYTINVVNGPNGANNKYLSGTYVCKVDGFNDSDSSRWTSVASFKANGAAGTITSGMWDTNGRDFTSEISGTATGTYSIGADNNGLMTMNSTVTSGGSGTHTGQYAIALNDTSPLATATEFRMVEIDDVGSSPSGMTGTGDCYQATTSGVFGSDIVTGNSFVFSLDAEDGSGNPEAVLGRFYNASGTAAGSLTGGIADLAEISATSVMEIPFTGGSYTTPDATNGRSTLTFAVSGGSAVFEAYAIDKNRMFVIETDGVKAQSGDVRKQQQTTYSGTNLSGPFVLYTQGQQYTGGAWSYYSTIMQGTGNGIVSAGTGSITINQDYKDNNGTYSVGSDTGGPIDATFDAANPGRSTFSPGGDQAYLYFFNTNSAFELDFNGSEGYLEKGWIEPQSESTFTYAAVAGTYLFGQLPRTEPGSNGNAGEFINSSCSSGSSSCGATGGITTAGQGDFSYDQSIGSGTYNWDTTVTGTGSFLYGTGSKGLSCMVISATRDACIFNGDDSPSVGILQQ